MKKNILRIKYDCASSKIHGIQDQGNIWKHQNRHIIKHLHVVMLLRTSALIT